MPMISIVVPVYNSEKYIHRCIDSILIQTFANFELILVNDGSTDESGTICDKYSKIDERIKVIHKKNGGPAEARNVGIDVSCGKYIAFVDSDDYIDQQMYSKLFTACKNSGINIGLCGRVDVFDKGTKKLFTLPKQETWSSKLAIKNLLTWNGIDSSPCDKLFDRKLFHDIRFPVNKNVEDIYTVYKLINLSNGVIHVGEPLYYYCHRSDSRSVEPFSIRRLDILEVSMNIQDFITHKYPDLKEEADSFYFKNILFLYKLLWPSSVRKAYPKQYRDIRRLITRDIYKIITNKYVDFRNKMISLLIFLGIYGLGKKLRQNQKK